MTTQVYSSGLIACSVCTDLPREEVAEEVNRVHPTGISAQWEIADESFADGSANPHPCEEVPAKQHWLLFC